MTPQSHHRSGRMAIAERNDLVRMLREAPITKVRAWTVARGKPRSYSTLAKLAALEDAQ